MSILFSYRGHPLTSTAKYRAFISYSHSDELSVEWLHKKLENYRVPSKIVGQDTEFGPIPRRLTPIFRDRDELATSDDLGRELTAAIDASMFLLVICSPASAQSRWVNEEIKAFKKVHGNAKVRAVIVGGEPLSGDPKTECFPEALQFKVDKAGELTAEPAEPIAADLRKGGDGKKYAISKLVAGLTGARLDDIVRREQGRRNARMRGVAAGFGAIAFALGALALDAMRQRDVARVAQSEAETQREAAVKARDDAEGMIAHILDELKPDIEAFAKLDSWTKIGAGALEYYGNQNALELSPDQLGRRARVMLMLGEADNLRGDLDEALAAYSTAAATTEEQLRRDPDNPDRIYDHSQSVFWVGYIAWQRGDAETARKYWTQYYDQANRLVEIDPDNDDYQAELEYSFSNLGTLEMDQGNSALAEEWFRKSLEVSKRLADKHPDDLERLMTAGQSYAWLADAMNNQTGLSEAREHRKSEILLYADGLSQHPNHTQLLTSRAIAHYRLAQIEIAAGELQESLSAALFAVQELEMLLQAEQKNTEFADRTALAHGVLGEAYFHSDQYEKSRVSLNRSIAIAQNLVERDKSVTKWRRQNLAHSQLMLGRLEYATENHTEAQKMFDLVRSALRDVVATKSAEPSEVQIYCSAISAHASLQESGEHLWQEIIGIVSPPFNKHRAETLVLLGEAHMRTGNAEKALSVIEALHAERVWTSRLHYTFERISRT